jgi:Uma2 family endonuclease
MSIVQTTEEVFYPSSDGMPMGETDIHRAWMTRIYELLAQRYRGQQVYVGSDLLLYYAEGMPYKFVVPDVFLVKDSGPAMRRVWQTWIEKKAPDVVLEVTSLSTRRDDESRKLNIYSSIGVQEVFLYDPTADYLSPPLKGFRLRNVDLEPLKPNSDGEIESNVLDSILYLDDWRLIMLDRATRQRLLTEAETYRAAQREAEARAIAAEEEVQRLREQLRQQKTNGAGN